MGSGSGEDEIQLPYLTDIKRPRLRQVNRRAHFLETIMGLEVSPASSPASSTKQPTSSSSASSFFSLALKHIYKIGRTHGY